MATILKTDFDKFPDWVRKAFDTGLDSYREKFGDRLMPTIRSTVAAHYTAIAADFIIQEGGMFDTQDEEDGAVQAAATTVEELCKTYHIHLLEQGLPGLSEPPRTSLLP